MSEKKVIDGTEHTEESVIKAYYGLATHFAKKFAKSYELDDLVSEALLALLLAFRNFNPDKGGTFAGYASQQMQYHLGKFARHGNSGFYVPHETERLRWRIWKEQVEHLSADEISQKFNVSERRARFALLAQHRGKVGSLDTVITDHEGEPGILLDFVGAEDDMSHLDVHEFLLQLNDSERHVVRRLYDQTSQAVIGSELGVTQMTVSRKRRKIGEKFKEWSAK